MSEANLAAHLGTLFPEVRPRGYLEVRSPDATDHGQRCASMVFVAGILGDDVAARQALELVGRADPALLACAGREGMRHARLAAVAGDLVRIAEEGAVRLGRDVVSDALVGSLRALELNKAGR